jgi:hypothetical protein
MNRTTSNANTAITEFTPKPSNSNQLLKEELFSTHAKILPSSMAPLLPTDPGLQERQVLDQVVKWFSFSSSTNKIQAYYVVSS